MCNYPHISPCFKILPSLKILHTHLLSSSVSPESQPRHILIYFLFRALHFLGIYINGIIQYVVSCAYILSFSIIHFQKVEKNVYEYFITFIWKLSLTSKYKEVLLLSMLRKELTVIFSHWEPMQDTQIFWHSTLPSSGQDEKSILCLLLVQTHSRFFKCSLMIDITFGNFMWERFPFCLLKAFYKASFLRGIIYHSLQFFPPSNLLVSPCGGI